MPMCAATVFREACSIRRSTPVVLQDVFKTGLSSVSSTTIIYGIIDHIDLIIRVS